MFSAYCQAPKVLCWCRLGQYEYIAVHHVTCGLNGITSWKLTCSVCFLGSPCVQLFHGKFWSCNDTSVPDKTACTGTFMQDGEVSFMQCPL